jgi:uncharacterized protein YdaU (DUF1376 family)
MSSGNGWMPLYIGDYLADTMELDAAQHGAYLLLLMFYWRNGPLPVEDAKLAQIARTDPRVWKKTVGPVVKAFFREAHGRLHQKRADLELAKAAECHERAAERRQADNDRLKAWRAKQGQDGSHPPQRANGKDPPETRFTGVSPTVSERVAKRPGNANETRLTITDTRQGPIQEGERVSKKTNSLPPSVIVGSRAREEARSTDDFAAFIDSLSEPKAAGDDELETAARQPDEPLPEPFQAHVRRAAKVMKMRIPYGEVRSVEAQLDALKEQPGAVGAEAAMGLRWRPAEPMRSPAQQYAELTGCSLAEAEAKFGNVLAHA